MNEQRFVVEITRPVPPDKVATVAGRIAGRLRLDVERIHTLLDGRVGPVTRPVLAEKADSIAEVFAEAGVRVIVVGAPTSVAAARAETGSTVAEAVPAETPVPETANPQTTAPEAPVVPALVVPVPADSEPTVRETAGPELTVPDPADPDPGDPYPMHPEPPTETAGTWDATSAWREGAGDIDQWQAAQAARAEQRSRPHEPTAAPRVEVTYDQQESSADQSGAAQAEHSDEDEADRLGPSSSRTMPEQLFTTSTRWVPSPHDAYGFDADEEPYVPSEEEGDQAADSVQNDYLEPRGYELPEQRSNYTWRATPLRTYLLWSLAASLVVLVLLQVVFAARGFGGADPLDHNVALRAYQQGDFTRAKRIWEPLAADGEPRAQYQLGFMAQHGLGQPWSNARAANYFRRAAEAGLPEAQLALGELYLRGLGVDQDAHTAAQWYHRAADSGHAEAQYQYALLVMHGEGVAQQFSEALSWFEAASAGGVARASDLVAFVNAASTPSEH